MWKKLWKWFDGHKMTFGFMFGTLAPHTPEDLQPYFYGLAVMFGFTGGAHKVKKAKKG